MESTDPLLQRSTTYRAFSTRDPGYAIISFAYASAILVHHAAVTSVSVVVESVVAEVFHSFLPTLII